jgi:hypothetical protein
VISKAIDCAPRGDCNVRALARDCNGDEHDRAAHPGVRAAALPGSGNAMNEPELTCRELVELVTDYLEGALAPADRERFEQHMRECEGCALYLAQMRQTVAVMGVLREEHLEPEARDALLDVFRRFRRADNP